MVVGQHDRGGRAEPTGPLPAPQIPAQRYDLRAFASSRFALRCKRCFDTRPQFSARCARRDRIRQRCQPILPNCDLFGKGRIGLRARTRRQEVLALQQAQNEFGGEQFVAGHSPASMQALSFARPRLIQLFIVPSGTPMLSASSA